MSTHKPKDTKDPASESGNGNVSRRDFLLKFAIGLNVVAGAMISVPLIGYVMSSFVKRLPLKWTSLGPVDKFPEGATRLATYENAYHRPWDGEAAVIPCWVRRITGEEFQVFAINCTHLGCPVRWFEESKLFMCPCHGGVFYEDGEHAAGPPPRALYTYQHKVENKELFIAAGVMPTLATPDV
ncbi:MAG TPA: Rieske 2Fe-2S domain-containing protein [Terrimicrobiaceae bacterium]